MKNLQESKRLALKSILLPIVRWCVGFGIGYRQLGQILKPLFYQVTASELARSNTKVTDTQIALVSGLHRADVVFFRRSGSLADAEDMLRHERIHPSSQVLARWIASGLPEVISIFGEHQSLDFLVKACCGDKRIAWSTPLLLQELVRQGCVEVDGQSVRLLGYSQNGDVAHFGGAVSDHINACLANLHASAPLFLEQAIVADGLFPGSVDVLSHSAAKWWQSALRDVAAKAVELSDKDERNGGNQRLRFGVYFYSEPMSGEVSEVNEFLK